MFYRFFSCLLVLVSFLGSGTVQGTLRELGHILQERKLVKPLRKKALNHIISAANRDLGLIFHQIFVLFFSFVANLHLHMTYNRSIIPTVEISMNTTQQEGI